MTQKLPPPLDLSIRSISIRVEFHCGCLFVRDLSDKTADSVWGVRCREHRPKDRIPSHTGGFPGDAVSVRAEQEIQSLLKEAVS